MARKFRELLIAGTLAAFAAPAGAQSYSDHYKFIKAVRERDGAEATSLLATPGSVLVNAKDRETGDGAVHIVTRERDLTWLAFLLGKDARIDLQNEEGMTALALAAQIGWSEGAQLLLDARAKADLENDRGETPLMFAVRRRDLPMVRLLVGKGADPHKTDSLTGYSALDYAKRDSRSAAIVKVLEEAKPARPVMGPGL